MIIITMICHGISTDVLMRLCLDFCLGKTVRHVSEAKICFLVQVYIFQNQLSGLSRSLNIEGSVTI